MGFKALIFDVDGVIAETEPDGHRLAFNQVFEEEGINAHWDLETYGKLLQIAGGKERMRTVVFSDNFKEDIGDKEEYIKRLHQKKTEIFENLVKDGKLKPRPGVKRLIQEAHNRGIKLGIATTSNINSATTLLKTTLGDKILGYFDVILAGDVVKKKKPDPEIYLLAAERLNVSPAECVVIEDMVIGLKSAKSAGMRCVITKSYYSKGDDFTGADLVVDSLGEPGDKKVVDIDTLNSLYGISKSEIASLTLAMTSEGSAMTTRNPVRNARLKVSLKEVFERALNEGWIVIASNIYTAEYVTGVARAMYDTKSPGIIQASSDTLPHLADVYSRVVKKEPPGVNDILRGAARLSEQRKTIQEELEEKGNPEWLSVYLAIDHSDPLNKIFIGTKEDLTEYHKLIQCKPQEEYFNKLKEDVLSFAKENPAEFTRTFVIKDKSLAVEDAINLLAKYLLFTEKVINGERVKGSFVNIDIDYIALDLSIPISLNIALTRVVTVTRDYYASSGRYVLIESGFGIEQEKNIMSSDEQKEYARKVLGYIEETNIDAVSCNIGTYHGEMVKGEKGLGSLHLVLMETVRDGLKRMGKPNVIIVAHGGSSIRDESLKELDISRLGLVKINKASVYISRYVQEVKDYVESPKVYKDGKFDRGASKGFNISNRGIDGVTDEAKRLFEFAGSTGKTVTLK